MQKHMKRIGFVLWIAVGVAIGYTFASRAPEPADTAATQPVCAGHGVPEDVCVRCHPELVDGFKTTADWCAEHGLPESQCSLCHPDLAAAGVKPPELAEDHSGHDESIHDTAPSVEPYPGLSVVFRTSRPSCPTDQSEIRLATSETAQRAGIEVQRVYAVEETSHFEAPAEVVFDENATTLLTSSLAVNIVRWLAESGDRVQEGDALALVESPDMPVLQAEFLEAASMRNVSEREAERAAGMVGRGLLDSASYERAVAQVESARAHHIRSESRLLLSGMSASDIATLQAKGQVSSRFKLRSPQPGTLLERSASLGRLLSPGADLARLGDPQALWVEAQVRERDAVRVRKGQRVEFTADGTALERVAGDVIWVSSFLDPSSRTATVRMRPLDRSVALRAHEFGRLHLPAGPAVPALWVPRDAVQWEGCCNVVFVEKAPDVFRPQKVDVAPGSDGHYHILKGLSASDRVVVAGSFLLKTELKKGAIGAGCCGLEAS